MKLPHGLHLEFVAKYFHPQNILQSNKLSNISLFFLSKLTHIVAFSLVLLSKPHLNTIHMLSLSPIFMNMFWTCCYCVLWCYFTFCSKVIAFLFNSTVYWKWKFLSYEEKGGLMCVSWTCCWWKKKLNSSSLRDEGLRAQNTWKYFPFFSRYHFILQINRLS